MGILSFLKPKKVPAPMGGDEEEEIPDEEYQLPVLQMGKFPMTAELRRRQQDEELKRRYGVHSAKEGSFL